MIDCELLAALLLRADADEVDQPDEDQDVDREEDSHAGAMTFGEGAAERRAGAADGGEDSKGHRRFRFGT